MQNARLLYGVACHPSMKCFDKFLPSPFQNVNKAGTAANSQGNKVGTALGNKTAQSTVTLQGAPQQGPMIGGKPLMQRQGAQPLVIGQLGELKL